MKIVTVVGPRPQFIKVAAMHRALMAHNQSHHPTHVQNLLVHTGQHYDANMSSIFFEQLGISPPDYQFEVGGSHHGAMTGKMLEQIEEVLIQEQPDWVLVFGDTNSTLAGALAAAKLCLPVAHVEAGLRSFNRRMPEEINRVVADHCSDLLFTTHAGATRQLIKEGVHPDKIHEVGDVMCDIARAHREEGMRGDDYLSSLGLKPKQYVLATVHRPSNTDDTERLKQILQGLKAIADEVSVIFPVHPRTRQAMQKLSQVDLQHPRLHYIDPVGYFEMLALESGARVIITDSGGVQKEAYFCHVPCLILRDETEWAELVQHGYSHLVESCASAIVQAYHQMLDQNLNWNTALYGSGHASRQILATLIDRCRP